MPEAYGWKKPDFEGLCGFLADKSFAYLGDLTALPTWLGKRSVWPMVFFHPGLSMPAKDTAAYREMVLTTRRNLERDSVRWLVLDRCWQMDSLEIRGLAEDVLGQKALEWKERIGPADVYFIP